MASRGHAAALDAGQEPVVQGKSILNEVREIRLAVDLFKLGARLQLLEAETSLSRNRLIKLYKEVLDGSPPKGMLPFSIDWFLTWQPNIHASLFVAIHRQLVAGTDERDMELMVKAYRLYLEQLPPEPGQKPVLSLTRAWTLIRFLNSSMLTTARCRCCHGEYVILPQGHYQFVCGLCKVPSRAGKTRKVLDEVAARARA
jgi:flagellar transcriptional activator FlhC